LINNQQMGSAYCMGAGTGEQVGKRGAPTVEKIRVGYGY